MRIQGLAGETGEGGGASGEQAGRGKEEQGWAGECFCLTPWGVLGVNQASSCLNARREAGLPTAVLFVHRLRATQGQADPHVLQSLGLRQ